MRLLLTLAVSLSFALLPNQSGLHAAAAEQTASEKPAEQSTAKLKLAPNETVIYVSDMHCAGCAKKIARKLYALKGVVKVRTDLKQDFAVITPQAKKFIDTKAAWTAVQSAGFKPTKLIGPQGTFVADEKTKAPTKVAEAPAPKRS